MPSPEPTRRLPRLARAVVVSNLVVQVAIVVTGGLVRLTGSGLGCPTWPECVPGSYTPTVEQELGLHPYIEFGNRLLTFVVGLAALGTLAVVLRWRRRLWPLGAVPLLGTVAQAVLGGITVLTRLHPVTVAAHFLVSAALVAASTWLLVRLGEPDGPVRPLVSRGLRGLVVGLAVVGAVVLVLGTVTTGAGPHSGDAVEPARLAIDVRTAAWLHADAVLLFCGLLIGLLVALWTTGAPRRTKRAALGVLGVTLLQGAIGYLQYFTGLPVVLVSAHMLGACLLVVALTLLVFGTRERLPRAPGPAADDLTGARREPSGAAGELVRA